jgi:outer membrane biosynthesis protein TonB
VFTTLVESRAARERRRAGTMVSVIAHTAVISLAVYATAKASTRPASRDDPQVVHYVQAPTPKPVPPPAPANPLSYVPPDVDLNGTFTVPESLPRVDLTKSVVDPDFWTRRAAGLTGSGDANTAGPRQNEPYSAVQVEKPAAPAPASAQPAYPAMLEESGISGQVLAQFVVDTLGHVEPGSFRVTQSDNDLFTGAVRAALPRMRFYPAEVDGHPVRQLVEQKFTFQLRN